MASTGTQVRFNRFRYPNSRVGLIVPIDHGLTVGPIDGVGSVSELEPWIGDPAITGIIAHKGMVERLAARGALGKAGVMLHLNGMSSISSQPNRKEMLTTVKAALQHGADAVSIQVNFDGQNDAHNLSLLGSVADEAHDYGLPVLAMIYDKVAVADPAEGMSRIRHLMRIAMELGCDALKLAAPLDLNDVPRMLRGMDIPVFFAGGALTSDSTLLELAQQAVLGGAAGLCLGRNIFQRPSPVQFLDKLSNVMLAAELTNTALAVKKRSSGEFALESALSN